MILSNLGAARGYRTILADPPWKFKNWSHVPGHGGAADHYNCLDMDDLRALPVVAAAAEDACLFLWATDPLLPEAMELMAAWGFWYKTVGFYWVKENAKNGGFFTGMGYWTRANGELCLLGTRGHPKRLDAGVRRLVVAPRREHSRKPDEVRRGIQRLVAGPYLEIFAREEAAGWDCWGVECKKFVRAEMEDDKGTLVNRAPSDDQGRLSPL